MMHASAFDGRCISSGGAWCTVAGLWEERTGQFIALGLVLCLLAAVILTIQLVMRAVGAFATLKKHEVEQWQSDDGATSESEISSSRKGRSRTPGK